jgi:hypothetical protein
MRLELGRRVGDHHLLAVGGSVVLDRLSLIDDVAEVALQRRRRIVLGEVDLVEGLVENRQGDSDVSLPHELLGDTRSVTGPLIVGEVADELHYLPLPAVTPPRGQALMRALLVCLEQVHRKVPMHVDQLGRPLPTRL